MEDQPNQQDRRFEHLQTLLRQILAAVTGPEDSEFFLKPCILEPLSTALQTCGILDQFCKTLASYGAQGPPQGQSRATESLNPPRNFARADQEQQSPRSKTASPKQSSKPIRPPIRYVSRLTGGNTRYVPNNKTQNDSRPPNSGSCLVQFSQAEDHLSSTTNEEERFIENQMKLIPDLEKRAYQECFSYKSVQHGSLLKRLGDSDLTRLESSNLKFLLEISVEYKVSDETLHSWCKTMNTLRRCDPIDRSAHSAEQSSTDQVAKGADAYEDERERVWAKLKRCLEAKFGLRYYCLALFYHHNKDEKELEERGSKCPRGNSFGDMALDRLIASLKLDAGKKTRDRIRTLVRSGERWSELCGKFTIGILEASADCLDANSVQVGHWKHYLDVMTHCCPNLENRCKAWSSQAEKYVHENSLKDSIDGSLFKQSRISIKSLDRSALPDDIRQLETLFKIHGVHQAPPHDPDKSLTAEVLTSASDLFWLLTQFKGHGWNIQVSQAKELAPEDDTDELTERFRTTPRQENEVGALPFWKAGAWYCVVATAYKALMISSNGKTKYLRSVERATDEVTSEVMEFHHLGSEIPIIDVWAQSLRVILSFCRKHDVQTYDDAIELLNPCWWPYYAACILASAKGHTQAISKVSKDPCPGLHAMFASWFDDRS